MTTVKCDETGCGWVTECPISDTKKWYRVPCPKCGRGQIINKQELRFIQFLRFLQWLRLVKLDVPPEESNMKFSFRRDGNGPTSVSVKVYKEGQRKD